MKKKTFYRVFFYRVFDSEPLKTIRALNRSFFFHWIQIDISNVARSPIKFDDFAAEAPKIKLKKNWKKRKQKRVETKDNRPFHASIGAWNDRILLERPFFLLNQFQKKRRKKKIHQSFPFSAWLIFVSHSMNISRNIECSLMSQWFLFFPLFQPFVEGSIDHQPLIRNSLF